MHKQNTNQGIFLKSWTVFGKKNYIFYIKSQKAWFWRKIKNVLSQQKQANYAWETLIINMIFNCQFCYSGLDNPFEVFRSLIIWSEYFGSYFWRPFNQQTNTSIHQIKHFCLWKQSHSTQGCQVQNIKKAKFGHKQFQIWPNPEKWKKAKFQ